MACYEGRLTQVRKEVGMILYLAGGWRSYKEIAEEFGFNPKTAYRNVRAMEHVGLPIEWAREPDKFNAGFQRVRLPPDWVARTPWLRKYLQPKDEPPPKHGRLYAHNGEIKTIEEWAAITGIKSSTLRNRIADGWPIAKALQCKVTKG